MRLPQIHRKFEQANKIMNKVNTTTKTEFRQQMRPTTFGSLVVFAALFIGVWNVGTTYGQNRIGDICTIKGQERNLLRGVGLVVGLQGSGDANIATTGAALAEVLTKSGMEIPRDSTGKPITEVFKDDKNSALVYVTAEIPTTGARQGSLVNCKVHLWGKASSLQDGFLVETSLTGGPINLNGQRQTGAGRAGALPVLARASGKIRTEADESTSGYIDNGCQMEVDFNNRFYEDITEYVKVMDEFGNQSTKTQTNRYINLVIKDSHASFGTAARVAEQIDAEIMRTISGGFGGEEIVYARAIDAVNIRVRFTPAYLQTDDPVGFARFLLDDITILNNDKKTKVVVNRRTNICTIGEDVYFSPVAITSGEFKIDIAPFKELSLDDNQGIGNGTMKLKRLVQALNDIQAPPSTIINVIKQLEAGGYLYGEIIEQ